ARAGCASRCCANVFFFSGRARHTTSYGDWSSDVCSSDLRGPPRAAVPRPGRLTWTVSWSGGGGSLTCRRVRARMVPLIPPAGPEIGRASCREREKRTERVGRREAKRLSEVERDAVTPLWR